MRNISYIPKKNPLEETDEFKALSKAQDAVSKYWKYKDAADCLVKAFKNDPAIEVLKNLKTQIDDEYDKAIKHQKKCLEAYNKLEDNFVLN